MIWGFVRNCPVRQSLNFTMFLYEGIVVSDGLRGTTPDLNVEQIQVLDISKQIFKGIVDPKMIQANI